MKKISFSLLALIFGSTAYANTPVPDVSPVSEGQHVVINIPQQRLFVYNNGKLDKVYKIAVGKAMTPTNLGEHTIGVKAFNPTWHIPKSIQKERNDGIKSIPPGAQNPLGPVFVRLGDPKLGLGIHGTNAPASVPGVRSHGCVRMKSPDALEFAKSITTGAPASVIYQMVSLNEDANKNLWLSAYRDPYNKKNLDTAALQKSISAWAKAHGKNINTKRVDAVLKARTGSPNCLSCTTKGGKLKEPLKSLAWTSGSGEFTKVKIVPKAAPVEDEVLPSGSEIEIDAGDTLPKSEQILTKTPQPARMSTQSATEQNASTTYEPAYTPTKPFIKESEPTESLF